MNFYILYSSRFYSTFFIVNQPPENCKQLADWLEELKELREFKAIYQKGMDYSYATFMYNKAIDDLTEKIVGYGTYDYYGNVIDVLEIAEKLKGHKTLNIIHCKDCIHWGTGIAGETENVKCCEYGKYMVGANGYCVYGERSVQNENRKSDGNDN